MEVSGKQSNFGFSLFPHVSQIDCTKTYDKLGGFYSPGLTTSQYVKYYWQVYIVTQRHLNEAMKTHKDAADEIKAWAAIVRVVRWHNFAEVRSTFKDADNLSGYVIFDIRHNRYRLVTVIHYARTTTEKRTEGHVYIRSFLTHKEYDNPKNWDREFGKK